MRWKAVMLSSGSHASPWLRCVPCVLLTLSISGQNMGTQLAQRAVPRKGSEDLPLYTWMHRKRLR